MVAEDDKWVKDKREKNQRALKGKETDSGRVIEKEKKDTQGKTTDN